MTFLSDRRSLNNRPIQRLPGIAVLLLKGVESVDEILRKHGEMLVGKVDSSSIDTFGDIFPDLVRVAAGDPGGVPMRKRIRQD